MPVGQSDRFGHLDIVFDQKRRCLGRIEDFELRDQDFDFAGFQLGIYHPIRSAFHGAEHSQNELATNGVGFGVYGLVADRVGNTSWVIPSLSRKSTKMTPPWSRRPSTRPIRTASRPTSARPVRSRNGSTACCRVCQSMLSTPFSRYRSICIHKNMLRLTGLSGFPPRLDATPREPFKRPCLHLKSQAHHSPCLDKMPARQPLWRQIPSFLDDTDTGIETELADQPFGW